MLLDSALLSYPKRKARDNILSTIGLSTDFEDFAQEDVNLADINNTSIEAINLETSAPFPLCHQWLYAIPNANMGQIMEAFEFRAAIKLRLLIPLFQNEQPCSRKSCSGRMDKFGHHSFACLGEGNLNCSRHDSIAISISDLSRKAGYSPTLNAPVQCLGENSAGSFRAGRPADILVVAGDSFNSTCIDVTVVSPLTSAKSTTNYGTVPGTLVKYAAKNKNKKYLAGCEAAGRGFLPFALDTCGLLDAQGWRFLCRLGSRIAERDQSTFSDAISSCYRRISFALQKNLARQLVSSQPSPLIDHYDQ